jgi:hypothetical protein
VRGKSRVPGGTDNVVLVRSNRVGKGPSIKFGAGVHVVESAIEKHIAGQGKARRAEQCKRAHHFANGEYLWCKLSAGEFV